MRIQRKQPASGFKYIKFCFLVLLIVMLVVESFTVGSGTRVSAANQGMIYYVSPAGNDSNPGTLTEPWRSVQKAADSLWPGDTVYVREGVYNEFVTINNSGSKERGFVTLQAYPGETPVIDGGGLSLGSGRSALLYLPNVSYVIIDGFEVRNLKASDPSHYPAGIRVREGGSNIHLLNNNVHQIEHSASAGNAHGIHVYGNSTEAIQDISISGNEVHHLLNGRSEALTLSGNIDGFSVVRNKVHDNNNIGIDIAGFYGACSGGCTDRARNGNVSENVVYNIDSSVNPAYGGVHAAGGIYADGALNVTIERNHVYQNDFGIELASEIAGKLTKGITVRNNLIHHNKGAGIIMGGSDSSNGGAAENVISNNTLIGNDTLNQGYGEITLQWNNADNRIFNNIIYSAPGKKFILKENKSGNGNRIDNNLLYQAGEEEDVNWSWEGRTYKTWAGYKRATGHDGSSLFADPLFSAPGSHDGRISPKSPAIGAGIPEGGEGNPLDLYGQARLTGSGIDIGAVEYSEADGIVTKPDSSQSPIPEQIPDSATATDPPSDENIRPAETLEEPIRADGKMDDWKDTPSISEGNSNVKSLKTARTDREFLVFVYGSLLEQKGQLYMNTDQNVDSGFQAPYWTASGADYLLENGRLYQYNGKGGTDWSWLEVKNYAKTHAYVRTNSVMEAAILYSDIAVLPRQSVSIGYVWNDSKSDRLPTGRELIGPDPSVMVSSSSAFEPIGVLLKDSKRMMLPNDGVMKACIIEPE